MDFCGAQLSRTITGDYHVNNTDYIKKLKPITIDKSRTPDQSITIAERRQLKGLLGSLAWPANQTSPHLQCSVSILQGSTGDYAKVSALTEANKLLRFAKASNDVGILVRKFDCHISKVTFVVLTDAAWAVRPDGTSQGGYIILMASDKVLYETASPYVVVDWRSFKLTRVSRSSLSCEAQAATAGVDALEFAKCFWSLCLNSYLDPRSDYTMQVIGTSALVIDAKALYDAAQKEHVHSFNDKRTGIEVMVLKERMKASDTIWRWVSSERQYADGLTKFAARQLLADRLRHGIIALVYDKNFTAANNKDKFERAKQESADSVTRKGQSKGIDKGLAQVMLVTTMTANTFLGLNAEFEVAILEKDYTDQALVVDVKPGYFFPFIAYTLLVIVSTVYVTLKVQKYFRRVKNYFVLKESGNQTSYFKLPEHYEVRDVAAQGPVNYYGVGFTDTNHISPINMRYVHKTQGFRDGFAVTHGESHLRHRVAHDHQADADDGSTDDTA